MEMDQYDVEIAQKYTYYYQGENSYYNQNTPKSKSSPGEVAGLLGIPFVIALFAIFKYALTILLVPAIPSMFAGYKISLLLSDPDTPTKLIFIVFFGFFGVMLQLGLIRVLIDYVLKMEAIKWILYLIFYAANMYLIFLLAENYPVKDLIHTKQTLLDIYSLLSNFI
jgi:hypothetical protein